jgi:hypothetical protein
MYVHTYNQIHAPKISRNVRMWFVINVVLIYKPVSMSLGSTQPLTEMSTRNLPGGKGRPAHKADNITAIYEPTV